MIQLIKNVQIHILFRLSTHTHTPAFLPYVYTHVGKELGHLSVIKFLQINFSLFSYTPCTSSRREAGFSIVATCDLSGVISKVQQNTLRYQANSYC